MTYCNRCGVTISGRDKRETENHCGFCSEKLGLKSMEYGNMNVVTDPGNATHFIFIGIAFIIAVMIAFSVSGSFDSYFEGTNTDKKIADSIKHQELTPEFCDGLEVLRDRIDTNVYSYDSIKMIDAKLLECDFKHTFPEIELKQESKR